MAEDRPPQLKGGEATAEQDKQRPHTPAATRIGRLNSNANFPSLKYI